MRLNVRACALACSVFLLFPQTVSFAASVTDLDISFCQDGGLSKKLSLSVSSLDWKESACIEYRNTSSESVSVRMGLVDGFMLSDGRPGCQDESASASEFSGVARYRAESSDDANGSFTVGAGKTIRRTIDFSLSKPLPSETFIGCVTTLPAMTQAATGGLNVLVRRANIVMISATGSAFAPVTANGIEASGTVASGQTASRVIENDHDNVRASGSTGGVVPGSGLSGTITPYVPAPVRAAENPSVVLVADALGQPFALGFATLALLASFAVGFVVARRMYRDSGSISK